jgi:cell division protein ZapA
MDNPAGSQTVRVTIFHQQYTVGASGDASEVESLAREVDDLMTSIAQRAGNIDATRVAVLACLHLADRLRTIAGELTDLKTRVNDKSRQFSVLLDRAIE